MWLKPDEMQALHAVRGEETSDRSSIFLGAQGVFDYFSGDICLRRVNLLIGGGDPILWALVARKLAATGQAASVGLALPPAFQGAPLAALHDDGFRKKLLSEGLYLPEPEGISGFMRAAAGVFNEAGGRIVAVADPISVRTVARGLMGIIDREGREPRRSILSQRKNFGLKLDDADMTGRAITFGVESYSIYQSARRSFMVEFDRAIKGFPPGRRYGDVILSERLMLATSAQGFIWADFDLPFEKIDVCDFCVSSSASISSAVDTWGRDLIRANRR